MVQPLFFCLQAPATAVTIGAERPPKHAATSMSYAGNAICDAGFSTYDIGFSMYHVEMPMCYVENPMYYVENFICDAGFSMPYAGKPLYRASRSESGYRRGGKAAGFFIVPATFLYR